MPQQSPPVQRAAGASQREASADSTSGSVAGKAQGSNAEAASGLAPAADAGLGAYTDTLGQFLGAELYRATHKALSFEALSGQGHALVDQAVVAMVAKAGGIEGLLADPAALSAVEGILKELAAGAADQWLSGEGKSLQESLVGWTDANPKAIAAVALLAAAGAVLANVEIPALAKKVNLADGLTAEVEVQLGRLRQIGLQKIRAQLDYASGPLVAAFEVQHEGGATQGKVSAGLTGDGKEVRANGKFDDAGLSMVGVEGAVDTGAGRLSGAVNRERSAEGLVASAKLEGKDGATTRTDAVTYDAATGKLVVSRDALTELGGGYSAGYHVAGANDGSREAKVSGAYTSEGTQVHGEASGQRAADGSVDAFLSAGVNANRDNLKLALDAAIQRVGGANSANVNASLDADLGNGHSAGAKVAAVLGETDTVELSAYYGFKDPNEFRSWMLQYQYASGADQHTLKSALEHHWGELKVRVQADATWGNEAAKVNVAAHAAYPMGSDTLGVAGMRYSRDALTGEKSTTAEVGVQYKGVQVLVGYEPDKKETTLKLGIPF